ncbi:MAG: hypothetical protein M3R17_16030 [Bacteroidota bacterium]|nr:hypothetical protein [Bacteroidota bacterium]
MKKQVKTIGFLAICLFAVSACKKAGTDGDATLVVMAKHHGTMIPNHVGYPDTVYVKFNAKDLPSDPTHDYDALFVGEAGEDHVHCAGLHTGTYYLYVTGYDSTAMARVTGGMSVKIKYKERKQEIAIDVPVTE